MAMWNHRLNLAYADAKYADQMETALYNGVLAGISLDGRRFFYVNPLQRRHDHVEEVEFQPQRTVGCQRARRCQRCPRSQGTTCSRLPRRRTRRLRSIRSECVRRANTCANF